MTAIQIDQSTIDALVARPAESLNVEVKRWIDPDNKVGTEKIVKAALALRNRNGGFILIGFKDDTLLPDLGNEPANIRDTFHLDKIQGLISRYVSELFEIGVGFCSRDGIEYPVIIVPEGVRTPVAAKRDLKDENNKFLIRHGAVYFRTLSANGTPSTAEARPEDWCEIIEICFDNREADIGRFLRRQLAGRDVASIVAALNQFGLLLNTPRTPTLRERAEALLLEGDNYFQRALEGRVLTAEERRMIDAGSWTITLVIDPARMDSRPDKTFISTIAASNPKYTGWPVWLDSRSFTDEESRPKIKAKAYEALIISADHRWSKHLDFSRLDPKGEFYLRRILQDDAVERKVAPGTALDPALVILRVAEAIAVGLVFAKALGWNPQQTRLGFAFRWQKLAGRQLLRWSDPYGGFDGERSHDNEAITFTEISLDTPVSAIAPFVDEVTKDLFVLFGGHVITAGVIEDWVRRLIERRLNF